MKPTEIIDRIAIVFNNLEHNGDTENANLLAELMNDIKALHITNVSKWVAIKDKMPEVGEWVLCGHCEHKWVDRGTMDAEGNFESGDGKIHPTHWTKLPEPPCC